MCTRAPASPAHLPSQCHVVTEFLPPVDFTAHCNHTFSAKRLIFEMGGQSFVACCPSVRFGCPAALGVCMCCTAGGPTTATGDVWYVKVAALPPCSHPQPPFHPLTQPHPRCCVLRAVLRAILAVSV
jgi:hypothetical protein